MHTNTPRGSWYTPWVDDGLATEVDTARRQK